MQGNPQLAINQRMERVTNETLVVGIDMAKDFHAAQATTCRRGAVPACSAGIEFHRRLCAPAPDDPPVAGHLSLGGCPRRHGIDQTLLVESGALPISSGEESTDNSDLGARALRLSSSIPGPRRSSCHIPS